MNNQGNSWWKIKAFLFDMDGVLVDSEEAITLSAIACLKEYGINAVPEDFLPFVGTGDDRFIGGVSEKYGMEYNVKMKERTYEIYFETLNQHLKVFKETIPFLEKIRAKGYKTAVASSSDRVKVITNLKVAGISLDLFDVLITGDDIAKKKPAPDIYLAASRLIDMTPAECVAVEDALNGIESAKAANMMCIGVTTSFDRETLLEKGADIVVDNLMEIDIG